MSELRLTNVSLSFGSARRAAPPVLEGVSLSLAQGEFVALIGRSGSGKTSLLNLAAGFLTPSAGTLVLDSTDLLPLPPEARPISILFQSETLFEHLTAAKNVALGGGTASEIEAALTEVGLPGIGGQRAETLSGGQKQRVALARTLLRNRPVLLLDEPFSALDDETRRATRKLVRTLTARHQWITLLVSHHADDIAALATRTYRIAEGRLVTA